MFDFLKSKGVPDVGKEDEELDKDNDAEESDDDEEESNFSKRKKKRKEKYPKGVTEVEIEDVPDEPLDDDLPVPSPRRATRGRNLSSVSSNDLSYIKESNNLENEKINARIEAVNARIGQLSERFSYLSESIGEIRTMNLENEKKIMNATKGADKVIDIVKEVKPEKLRIDYQKSEIKVKTLEEKIEANKQFMETLLREINDLKKKANIFIGTEGIMKLNEDTKKDIIEIQKINSKTRLNADKAQEIFMEIKKGFAESQKVNSIINDLNESYSNLKERIEKLSLRYGKIVSQDDFSDFKKSINSELSNLKSAILKFNDLKAEDMKVAEIAETALSVSKRNESDIADIALQVGSNGVKKVSNLEDQIGSILEIIEEMTGQISEMRKKLGYKVKRINTKEVMKKEKIMKKEKPIDIDEETGLPDVELKEESNSTSSTNAIDEALSKIEDLKENSSEDELFKIDKKGKKKRKEKSNLKNKSSKNVKEKAKTVLNKSVKVKSVKSKVKPIKKKTKSVKQNVKSAKKKAKTR
jgi:hypothetical protein